MSDPETKSGGVDRSLSATETDRLAELEDVVGRGMRTFVEVGAALCEIRDQRLYRVMHATFEGYCRERWGFTASRARSRRNAPVA